MLKWQVCENRLGDYLASKHSKTNPKTIYATAQKIADCYHLAVKDAIPKRNPGFTVVQATFIGLNKLPVQDGFHTVLKRLSTSKSESETKAIDWSPAAAGILKYWTGKQLLPSAPPPVTPWLDIPTEFGTAPPPPAAPIPIHTPPLIPPSMVLVPGTLKPLDQQLRDAFNKKKPRLVAKFAVIAFQNHAKLISGMMTWLNTAPPVAPPVPTPFPWTGIQ